jgi:hypothetical protein
MCPLVQPAGRGIRHQCQRHPARPGSGPSPAQAGTGGAHQLVGGLRDGAGQFYRSTRIIPCFQPRLRRVQGCRRSPGLVVPGDLGMRWPSSAHSNPTVRATPTTWSRNSSVGPGRGGLTVHGDGEQARDFTYVDDTVRGFLTMGSHRRRWARWSTSARAPAFHPAPGPGVGGAGGSRSRNVHTEVRVGEVQKLLCNPARARRLFGGKSEESIWKRDWAGGTSNWGARRAS